MELVLVLCDGNERTAEDDSADLDGTEAILSGLNFFSTNLCKAHVEYDSSGTEWRHGSLGSKRMWRIPEERCVKEGLITASLEIHRWFSDLRKDGLIVLQICPNLMAMPFLP